MMPRAGNVILQVQAKIQKHYLLSRQPAAAEHCQRIVSQIGRRVDGSSPICDARLPDGFASTQSVNRFLHTGEIQKGQADARCRSDRHDYAAGCENFRTLRRNRAEFDRLIERQLVLFEFADCEGRSVDRKRGNDCVDARTVRQAGVADRRGISSTRRPIWLTIRWQMFSSCWLSRKRIVVFWIFPWTSM